MSTPSPIYLKQSHVMALRNCLREYMMTPGVEPSSLKLLAAEVERAIVVPDHKLPPDTVALGSTVAVEYCDDGEQAICRLVLPREAAAEAENISVLTPLGLALLGCRLHQTIEWPLTQGRGILQVRILNVITGQQPSINPQSPTTTCHE